jgi:hypothetical protein
MSNTLRTAWRQAGLLAVRVIQPSPRRGLMFRFSPLVICCSMIRHEIGFLCNQFTCTNV